MVGLSRSSWYYQRKDTSQDLRRQNSGRPIPGFSKNRDDTIVLDRTISSLLIEYRQRPEYSNGGGYRKLTKMLRRDYGIYANKKKIYRLCQEAGLLLEQRSTSSRPKRFIARNRVVIGPNQLWQCDLKYGYVEGERRFFFILAFIDVFTRKVVGVHVGLRCQAGDLRNTLAQAILAEGITKEHGLIIRSDNGPQMTSNELSRWLAKLEEKLTHEFIPIRTPNKNAHIESFFSILELELLLISYFSTFADAYEKTHAFINFYNTKR
ncbi:MAG TPA: DDE-type integrase/transposase/recombinase, partial [Myxococcota bacterium]|nr:DDE-type integrase/transposase/recombinase [Myxococcota bacterium]